MNSIPKPQIVVNPLPPQSRRRFPREVSDFANYAVHLDSFAGRVLPSGVTTLADPPRHHYFDPDLICRCQEEASGIRIANVCIHERIACTFQRYFICPHCLLSNKDPDRQFLLMENEVYPGKTLFYLVCVLCVCNKDCTRPAESWHQEWMGRGMERPEAEEVSLMLYRLAEKEITSWKKSQRIRDKASI